jgi:putative acetyltransferase
MQIRRSLISEAEALSDLWLRSVRATHDFLTEQDISCLLPVVKQIFHSDLEIWVLCDDESTLMGFLGLSGSSVEALFLAPEYFRQGFGRHLLRYARELKWELTVSVNEQNPAALRFYEACGFVKTGRSEVDGSGRPFPLIHMRQTAVQ